MNTLEIANKIGIHPNTVRFYEEIELLPTIPRKENGYRVYSEIHLEQLKLIRMALKSELLQNGLRKQVFNIVKESAKGNYEEALNLSKKYLENIQKEQQNTEDSIKIVDDILLKKQEMIGDSKVYTRKQMADYLELTIDTLRNWELNGLIEVRRKENGYRVYDGEDIKRLKIIRALKCANFSLSSILRLLNDIESNENINLKEVIDTPKENEDIISVCDRLLTSLENAKKDTEGMIEQINKMKK